MKYCKKCTMPDTRPGITFDSEGVCSACRHFESRKTVDWEVREKELGLQMFWGSSTLGEYFGGVLRNH